jgi:type I restriction enzyme S subunit
MTVFRSKYNKFLYWVFNSTLFDYQAGAFGTSTINQLTTETLDNMEVPIPPETEQREISAYLINISKKFNDVISSIRNSVGLAKERRAALITAAVTGQIPIEAMQVHMEQSHEN